MLPTRASIVSILVPALVIGGLHMPAHAQTLAITGATIIDGTGKAPLRDGLVLIRDGRIIAVGRSPDITIPDQARRLDARGKYVIPGLMDANLHLGGSLGLNLDAMIKYDGRYRDIALEAAQITLKAGLTTVFDTWGPRSALVQVRDLINRGDAPGSRIYLAGNIIGVNGPVSPDFIGQVAPHVSKAFAKRINETFEQGMGRTLLRMSPEEVRSAIREYAQKDVDFLKYVASGLLEGHFITFSPRVQRVIVDEGHRAGLTVQAHATSVESLDLALDAGVDIVTHGDISGPTSPIPPETIRKLVERGIAVSVLPVTQRHLQGMAKRSPDGDLTLSHRIAKMNRHNLIKAGIPMLVSTDAWFIEDPVGEADTIDSQWKLGEGHFNALVALEEEGMDRMELLRSVTSHIAKAYKLDGKLGTLEPGKIADLVILDANPLESARNFRRIHTVIKDGKVVDVQVLPITRVVSSTKVFRSGDGT